MAERFFAYSYESGFELFDTSDEAKLRAEQMLKINRDWEEKNGLWDSEVVTIMWGEIFGKIKDEDAEKHFSGGVSEMRLDDLRQCPNAS